MVNRHPKVIHCSYECRFWSKVNIKNNIECWDWKNALNASGYGHMQVRRTKEQIASRIAWILTNGPILNGLHVLHICDRSICCNPEHLFLGTHKDNMQDMANKKRGAQVKGQDQWFAKLTDEQVMEIRFSKERIPEIQRKFNLSRSHISAIKIGTAWKHLPLNENHVKGTKPKGFEHKHSKLTPQQVKEIEESKENYLIVAEKYGIKRTLVYAIRNKNSGYHKKCIA